MGHVHNNLLLNLVVLHYEHGTMLLFFTGTNKHSFKIFIVHMSILE